MAVSRRTFLKAGAATAGAAGVAAVGVASVLPGAKPDDGVLGPGTEECTLSVNGRKISVKIEPRVTLLRALRNYADVTGPKEICDRGACGGCAVLVDGTPVASCMMLALDAVGREITTVEGLAKGGVLHPVQQAFVECDAYQCGYCTPGFIMTSVAMLKSNPDPSREEIRDGLQGNLCRCAAYNHIFDAVALAADRMKKRS